MKELWSPWRMEYILKPKKDNQKCAFCSMPPTENNRKNLVLFRGENIFVVMNLYPYNNGHLMIVPNQHTGTTFDLNPETLAEIMTVADKSMAIVKKIMKAEGFNFGANIGAAGGAGIEEHIHFHIVPRWRGDTNFMPVLGHTKVQMQGLLESYDQLKPQFDKLNQEE